VKQFGRAPRVLAADRGMSSAANERLAKEAGIKHVALPHVGKASAERRAEEKGRRFREAYKFRAGIEGRIHALRRDYGLKRSRYHGERGMGRWVGWGVVAHNLSKIAEAGSGRSGGGAEGGIGPTRPGIRGRSATLTAPMAYISHRKLVLPPCQGPSGRTSDRGKVSVTGFGDGSYRRKKGRVADGIRTRDIQIHNPTFPIARIAKRSLVIIILRQIDCHCNPSQSGSISAVSWK
jgi:Transposase DDE domain